MKKITLFAMAILWGGSVFAGYNKVWTKITKGQANSIGTQRIQSSSATFYQLNEDYMKSSLSNVGQTAETGTIIEVPTPEGTFMSFMVWETPLMAKELAAKYPSIKTYSGYAIDQEHITIKTNMTEYGFDAMVYNGANTFYIDAFSDQNNGYYQSFYRKSFQVPVGKSYSCAVADDDEMATQRVNMTGSVLPKSALKTSSSGLRRVYRLALACTGEYAIAVTGTTSPTKAQVISKMAITLARVNGVYQKELSVLFELVSNNDTLVYLDPATDPFSANNNGPALMSQNQTNTNAVIGTLNYDIGHIFSTGGGGIADIESACHPTKKARGVTGQPNPVGDPFDIDYVAHEMGHQLGAEHTFNSGSSSCAGNGSFPDAYEAGGGSTIMAYAGICAPDDLQSNSDDYFHNHSLDMISDFITNIATGASCGSAIPSGNNTPSIPPYGTTYNIPYKTPFELTAPEAVDADNNGLYYCWDQHDLGDFGKTFANTLQDGPIFRSFRPTLSRTRVFPTLDKLLVNVNSYTGEKLPEVTRDLTFRLSVRDQYNGSGAFNFSTDEIILKATSTSGPFLVKVPNDASVYWQEGSTVTVTWDVANTTAAPVSASNVDIFLSVDGGYTYPYTLKAATPNDGSETVVVPSGSSTASARVKVKGAGNVFFDISNENFKINTWPANVENVIQSGGIYVYPSPAKDVLNINIQESFSYNISIMNTVGQVVYQSNNVIGATSISVYDWAGGVYTVLIVKDGSDKRFVQKVVVE